MLADDLPAFCEFACAGRSGAVGKIDDRVIRPSFVVRHLAFDDVFVDMRDTLHVASFVVIDSTPEGSIACSTVKCHLDHIPNVSFRDKDFCRRQFQPAVNYTVDGRVDGSLGIH